MNSNDYWADRAAQNMYEDMKTAEERAEQLSRLYAKASQYNAENLHGIFNRYKSKHNLTDEEARSLIDGADSTRYEDLLRRLKNTKGQQREEIIREIEAPAYKARMDRLIEAQRNLDASMRKVATVEYTNTTDAYRDIYKNAYEHSVYEMSKKTGLDLSAGDIDSGRINDVLRQNWSGKNYSERIWSNTQRTADVLKDEMLMGLLTGKTEKEMADVVTREFQVANSKARRLVRTESSFMHNQATLDSYKDHDIKKYMYVATLDKRTSEICSELDGKTFKVSEAKVGENYPPMHPWCRSTTIMALDKKTLSGLERQARDPETGETKRISASTTYEKWIGKKRNTEGEKQVSNDLKKESPKNTIKVEKSDAYKKLLQQCTINNVLYNDTKRLERPLTGDEIIRKISGGDKTKGSCVSLCMAYVGNRIGIDVTDYRGGISQSVFSSAMNNVHFAELPGVKGFTKSVKKEITGTIDILNEMEKDKEYWLLSGKHSAIVRNSSDRGYEYLELQSADAESNTWTSFNEYGSISQTLNKRFGCRKTVRRIRGIAFESDITLMEVDSFKGSEEFENILGYINTSKDKQRKGATGYAK